MVIQVVVVCVPIGRRCGNEVNRVGFADTVPQLSRVRCHELANTVPQNGLRSGDIPHDVVKCYEESLQRLSLRDVAGLTGVPRLGILKGNG